MTTTHRKAFLAAMTLVLCWSAAGHASTPRFWQFSTQGEMLKGEVDRLSVDDTGRLVLGPAVKAVFESTVPFIWCLTAGADGTVYAGSGNEGQVWRIDSKGKATEFFKAKELEVHAIAAAPDGAIFVGTSPDGKVYRVDARGQSSVYFDSSDKYIWALVLDKQGRLYVGTGDKGVIYRVTAPGQSEVFYKTNTRNVTSLTFDADGRMLAATDSPGRVLRIDAAGKAFAVLDSPFREMRALRLAPDGTLFAAAVNGKAGDSERPTAAPAPEAPKPPIAGVSTEIMSITVLDVASGAGQSPAPSARSQEKSGSKGAVYRIDKDGGYEIIWESREDLPFDLGIEDGAVIVATGNGGKLYRVAGSPAHTTLVTRLGGQQVTSLISPGPARYFATSNPAKVYLISSERASEGSYLSDVKDAGMAAAWGTITWRALEESGSRVQLLTRSGNTAVPDDTWSPWSAAYAHSDGDAIVSPAARYLQWKATLSAASTSKAGPALASVKVGYQQHNVRPKVTAITVLPPGTVYQRPFPTGEPDIAGLTDTTAEARVPLFSLPLGSPQIGQQLGRRMYQKGLQTFTWKAEDDNDDRMSYDVFYRTVDRPDWRLLRRGLNDQILTWDTTSVPDGTYLIKVAASDAPGNPAAQALSGELESEAFDVDNTPPVISLAGITREGASATALIEVRDAHSPIGAVEYSVDAGRWTPIYPVDGLADRKIERYAVKVDAALVDRVVIRAADVLNNLATMKVDSSRK